MSYNPIHTKKELEQMKKEQGKPTTPATSPHKPDEHPHNYNPIHTKQELEQRKQEQEKHEPEFKQPDIKISYEEYTVFIGPNDDDYLPAFEQFQVSGVDKFVRTWNWGAFIGGPWWFLYRKMHTWAALYFVAALPFFVFVPILGLLPMAGLGISGNYIYYKYAKKKITEVKMMHPVRDISPELKDIGGIYKWGFYAGVLGTVILFFVIWVISLAIAGMSILNGGK